MAMNGMSSDVFAGQHGLAKDAGLMCESVGRPKNELATAIPATRRHNGV